MREPLDHFWICWVKLGLPGQMGHPLYLTYLRYLHMYILRWSYGVRTHSLPETGCLVGNWGALHTLLLPGMYLYT